MNRMLGASVAGVFVLAAAWVGAGPAAADSVPYSDPAQVGFIGFCDASGHEVTGGSLDAIPFVAKAVSSAAPQSPYNVKDAVAFIEAHQPRQGVTPAEWSGEQLISSSVFTTPSHPTAVGTKGDISIGQFVGDYPAAWGGLVQVRMYWKTDELPVDSLHYAATDIKIDGNSWKVVRGGSVTCSAGSAKSVAEALVPGAASGSLNSTDEPSGHPATPGQSTGSQTSAAGPGTPTDSSTPSSDTAGASNSSDDGGSFPTGYVVLGALVLILGGALAYAKRDGLRHLINSALPKKKQEATQ